VESLWRQHGASIGETKAIYVSDETFEYSPSGLSWNRWVDNKLLNEKQENGLIGTVTPTESFLMCKRCTNFFADSCKPNGVCNVDKVGGCDCMDGWYGARCHLKSVESMELQITFDYNNNNNMESSSAACLVSMPFDPLPPLYTGKSFTLDLIPPILINGTRVGMFLSMNTTHFALYESSCQDKRKKELKVIRLPGRENNYMDFVLQNNNDVYVVTGSGGIESSSEFEIEQNGYCSYETYSDTIPRSIRHFDNLNKEECESDFFEYDDDPILANLERVLIKFKFETLFNRKGTT